MPVVKTSAKGQVVIPVKFREQVGIRPGDKVLVTLGGGRKVTIEPVPEDPIEATCGILQGGPSLTKALLKERREDHAREEKKFARLSQQGKRVRKG